MGADENSLGYVEIDVVYRLNIVTRIIMKIIG